MLRALRRRVKRVRPFPNVVKLLWPSITLSILIEDCTLFMYVKFCAFVCFQLSQDFDFMFKEISGNLYLNWEGFEAKLLTLAKQVVSDKFGLSALNTLTDVSLHKG